MAPKRAAAAMAKEKLSEKHNSRDKVAKSVIKGPGKRRGAAIPPTISNSVKEKTDKPRRSQRKATKTNNDQGTTSGTKVQVRKGKAKPAIKSAKGQKRKAAEPAEPQHPKRPKLAKGRIINQLSTQKLNVYVCGEVSGGELGLGPQVKKVKRPRLNPNLLPGPMGVVQVAAGGMHALALTHDNRILSWGVNDNGALGRDTTWEGKLVDIDDADSDSDTEMNPLESTPAAISQDYFPPNTTFTQVAAGDSSSFALTDDGRVYGWGSFRSNDGAAGFTINKQGNVVEKQPTPVLLPTLKGIIQIACGADHVLALDQSGRVYAWGNGQQKQLGRRISERTTTRTLVPTQVSIPGKKIVTVGCGAYHSFAIDKDGGLWSWGLNSYGETGIPIGEDEAISHFVTLPQKVENMNGKKLTAVDGGSHHSVGVTTSSECLVWGRLDGGQCGIDVQSLSEDRVIKDVRGNPRILAVPTAVPHIETAAVAAGSDHTIAVTNDGRAYSWGFNATFQLGQGGSDDDPEDISVATLIDNTALRSARVNWAGAGGQYSILTAPAESLVDDE